MRLIGIKYALEGVVRLRKSVYRETRRSSNSQPQYFDVEILPPMPLLDIIIPELPEAIMSGELVKLRFKLRNKGERGMKTLRVKSSHSSFFWFGDQLTYPQKGLLLIQRSILTNMIIQTLQTLNRFLMKIS